MIQMINKLKKNQKGFTLVELIVVLVILAILAAFTIPAMLGFVDDARGKAAVAEGREGYVAAQAATTDVGAKGSINNGDDLDKIVEQVKKYTKGDLGVGDADPTVTAIIAEEAAEPTTAGAVSIAITPGGTVANQTNTAKVAQVKYLDKTGKYVCTITPNADGTSAEFEKK